MTRSRTYRTCWVVLGLLVPLAYGCRAHPVSLGVMLIGDAVNDADVQQRAEKLIGRNIAAADEMFGARRETLEDTGKRGRWIVVYPVKDDILGTSRYVVESSYGSITALSRTIQNIDGAEDIIREMDLRPKLIGKDKHGCRKELSKQVVVLRDMVDGTLVRIYDVRNWTHLSGARYCVLRFDADDNCEQVNLVGVSASTKPDPARD